MRLLMPKPFNQNKIIIYKNFSLLDFLIFIVSIISLMLFVLFLPINSIFKMLLAVLFAIPSFILVLWNKKNNCRNYVMLIRIFKSKSYHNKFIKKPLIIEDELVEEQDFVSGIELVKENEEKQINIDFTKIFETNFETIVKTLEIDPKLDEEINFAFEDIKNSKNNFSFSQSEIVNDFDEKEFIEIDDSDNLFFEMRD